MWLYLVPRFNYFKVLRIVKLEPKLYDEFNAAAKHAWWNVPAMIFLLPLFPVIILLYTIYSIAHLLRYVAEVIANEMEPMFGSLLLFIMRVWRGHFNKGHGDYSVKLTPKELQNLQDAYRAKYGDK